MGLAEPISVEETPMILQLTEREKRFLDQVREFVRVEVKPNHRKWEIEGGWPDSLWKPMADMGLLHMVVPQEMGGFGVSCQTYAEAVREVSKGDGALGMNVAALNALGAGHLVNYATPEQRELYLPKVISGEMLLAWGLTEPTAGTDARGVRTTAVPDVSGKHGPDRYLLNGEKMFITNGGRAHLIVIIARLSEEELGGFLLQTNDPGFELLSRIETTGVKASYTTRFRMHDAIGWRTNGTFRECISLLYRGRIGIGSMALGIGEAAFEAMVEHAKTREQFGKPLAKQQAIQWMIADSKMELEAGRLMLHKAAWMYDEGQDMVSEASQAKLLASIAGKNATDRAIQILGGRGYTVDYDVEKYWRDARLCEIGEGSSEVQRIIIAKRALR
jgi:alkylation response protein AidB-like acyl-CoA dehydrogenase